MNRQMEGVSTDRLILRPLANSDLEDIHAYASDPDVTRYMDWPRHQSMDETRAWLTDTLSETSEDNSWVFALRQTSEFVGLFSVSPARPDVSLGYLLLKRFWGQGLATEIGRAIVAMLMADDSVARIHATCDVDNAQSIRVLEKMGLRRQEVLTSWLVRPNMAGQPKRDAYLYALSKN